MTILFRLLGLVGLSPASLLLYGGIALAGVIAIAGVAGGIYHAGYASAEGKCEAAALRARVAELQTQLKNANDQAARSAGVIVELQAADQAASVREDELRREVAAAKLQSTKPGARRDANAILDDQCNLTDRGARRMRGR